MVVYKVFVEWEFRLPDTAMDPVAMTPVCFCLANVEIGCRGQKGSERNSLYLSRESFPVGCVPPACQLYPGHMSGGGMGMYTHSGIPTPPVYPTPKRNLGAGMHSHPPPPPCEQNWQTPVKESPSLNHCWRTVTRKTAETQEEETHPKLSCVDVSSHPGSNGTFTPAIAIVLYWTIGIVLKWVLYSFVAIAVAVPICTIEMYCNRLWITIV